MKEVKVAGSAKINLTLDILGKRPDGYHEVEMIMQSLKLFDQIAITITGGGGIALSCSDGRIPSDERNLAWKAAAAYLERAGVPNPGISISVEKKIPLAAGLAGGSADAAAVLLGLNRLLNGRLEDPVLMDVAGKIGADVPFCLTGGTMLARGIGEKLTRLEPLPACFLVLAKPNAGISTAEAYRKFDRQTDVLHPDTKGMIAALSAGSLISVGEGLRNVLEPVAELEEVARIEKLMNQKGAVGACMSGSGPTVFGIFDDITVAKACVQALGREYREVYLTEPSCHGCEILEN